MPGVRFVPPEAIETGVTRAASGQLMDDARQRVTQLWPWASAPDDLMLPVRIAFVAVLAALIGPLMAATLVARPILVPVTALLLLGPGLLRFLAALPSPGVPPPKGLADAELRVYSVLLPLRDEARTVPQLSRATAALDYAPEKLDVKSVVEQRSQETVRAVRAILGDPPFRLVEVPEGLPTPSPRPSTMPCHWCAGPMSSSTMPRTCPTPTSCAWPPAALRLIPRSPACRHCWCPRTAARMRCGAV